MTATVTPPRTSDDTSSPNATPIARVRRHLDEIITRLRRTIWIEGSLAVATAALVSLLALLVADALMQPESTSLRLAFWLPVIGVVAVVGVRHLARPLRRECDRFTLAWKLEQKRPAIEERLTTSLQFEGVANARSNALINAVAQQADDSLARHGDEDLKGPEIFRRVIVTGACLAAFLGSMAIWSPYLWPSLLNVFNPWNARVLPHLNATILPGETRVAEGSDLRVTAAATRLNNAVLEVIEDNAVVASHQMVTGETDDIAAFTLTQLDHAQQYRVSSGGLYSERFEIVVDPQPVIERVNVDLNFPEYTQLAPQAFDHLTDPVTVIHGTRLGIAADATIPCSESFLQLNETRLRCAQAIPLAEADQWQHSWEFTAQGSDLVAAEIVLVSEAGVRSEPLFFELQAQPDSPPSVIVNEPSLSDMTATIDQKIDVAFATRDDFGCGELQLVWQINDDPPTRRELPHDWDAGNSGELAFELTDLDLNIGDRCTFWLSVSDNRPLDYGGPQTADSRKIRIQIADQAASVGQQMVRLETQSMLDQLTQALSDLNAAKKIANELQANVSNALDAADPANTTLEAVEEAKQILDHINNADQALNKLTDQEANASDGFFPEQIERIQDVTDNNVAEAKKQAGLIPLSDDLRHQQQAITATKESLSEAIEKLEETRDDVVERSERLELAAQLDQLAREQDRLAQELNAGPSDTPEAKRKQQQVADALQDLIENDLDAKSEQFSQRAERAAELTKTAAELQKQQEDLAQLDRAPSKEDLEDQLLELIAKEQAQIANDARQSEDMARDNRPQAADGIEPAEKEDAPTTKADANQTPNALSEARKRMDAVPEKLKAKQPLQAEREARQAGERLREAKSLSDAAKEQPSDTPQNDETERAGRARETKDDLDRLARQQERIGDAIKAVREGRPDDAVAKLQEQVAERTEQLREDADELLALPTQDPENQQAIREASEKLEQAEKETKAAKKLSAPKQRPTAGQLPRSDNSEQAVNKPQQGDDKKPGEEQQLGQEQADKPTPASDEQKPADAARQAGTQPPQASDSKQAAEQKKQAAKSLREAAESLDAVCKSCQKCSKCNKRSASSGGAPKSSSGKSTPKPGQEPSNKSRPGAKPAPAGQPSPDAQRTGSQKPDSQKLASTTDKAHESAREPSPGGTRDLAKDLNQLADEAAQQAGYPYRDSQPQDGQEEPQQASNSSQQEETAPGQPSQPQGVQGDAGTDQSDVAPVQLRGPATSNWTQPRRKRKSNVLDNQDSKIPEEFRGVVKDYFEELSRLESNQNAPEEKE